MAKAEIIKHLGEGQYQVSLKYAVERVQAELERINVRIAELAVEVPTQKSLVLAKKSEISGLQRDIDAAIPDYQAGIEGAADRIRDLQVELAKANGDLARLQYELDLIVSENLALLKRRAQIERIPEDKTLVAWCADYTTELAGTVGVADINDEGGQGIVIKPGFSDAAAYSPAEDGVLMPREAQSGVQVYLNAALLPGVQKWFPRYRLGTIRNIENDKCQVELLAANSSAQNLPINRESVLSDVPIQYMECNGDAFEDGDTVVVRFTKSGPLVIGFYTEPRACELGTFVFMPTQYYTGNLRVFGEPEIEGDPLGTPIGENPVWYLKPEGSGWNITKYQPMNYGCQDWQGPDGLVLTWRAAPGRCYRSWAISLSVGNFYARSTEVFCRGKVVADIAGLVSNALVYGAGVKGETLTVIARDTFDWYAFAFPWDNELKNTTGPGAQVHTWPVNNDAPPASGFYFNKSGTEAIITLNEVQEKVSTQKYIVGIGPQSPTVIWERGYEGVLSSSNELSDQGVGVVWALVTIEQQQHQIPIYVDFVGDSEVTLFLRHKPYSYRNYLDREGGEHTQTYYQAAVDLVLSTGEVLASIGPYHNRQYFLGNYDTGDSTAPDEMTLSDQRNTSAVTGRNVFFDIRYRAVMLEIDDVVSSDYFSGPPNPDGYVPGTVSLETRTRFEMHVDGALVFRKVAQEVSNSYYSSHKFRLVPDDLGGAPGEVLGPKGPPLFNNQELVNVGFHKSGSKEIASLFVHYPSTYSMTGDTETVFENKVSGYSNVELQLFGGREDMMLYGIGLR